jgi:hypothetical protein
MSAVPRAPADLGRVLRLQIPRGHRTCRLVLVVARLVEPGPQAARLTLKVFDLLTRSGVQRDRGERRGLGDEEKRRSQMTPVATPHTRRSRGRARHNWKNRSSQRVPDVHQVPLSGRPDLVMCGPSPGSRDGGFHDVAVKWLPAFRVTTLSRRTVRDALSRLYRYLYIADG